METNVIDFIEHLLATGACQLELSSQGLANLAAGLSLQVVRSLLHQSRRAPLTMEMVRNLHNGLGISAEVLIQPYSVLRDAA